MNTAELAMMYKTGQPDPALARRQLDRDDRKGNQIKVRCAWVMNCGWSGRRAGPPREAIIKPCPKCGRGVETV